MQYKFCACIYFVNRKLDEALEYHQQARILDPQSPSTYSAIGIVLALKGDTIEAVDYFHKVCSCNIVFCFHFLLKLLKFSLS